MTRVPSPPARRGRRPRQPAEPHSRNSHRTPSRQEGHHRSPKGPERRTRRPDPKCLRPSTPAEPHTGPRRPAPGVSPGGSLPSSDRAGPSGPRTTSSPRPWTCYPIRPGPAGWPCATPAWSGTPDGAGCHRRGARRRCGPPPARGHRHVSRGELASSEPPGAPGPSSIRRPEARPPVPSMTAHAATGVVPPTSGTPASSSPVGAATRRPSPDSKSSPR